MVVRPATYPLVLLALASLGASCSGGPAADEPVTPDRPAAPTVRELDAVDVSQLIRTEQELWVELINDQLSPCGDPVSVGRCATDGGSCRRCVPAARYLARLVAEGYERSEIEERYRVRYAPDEGFELDLDEVESRGSPMAEVVLVEFSDFECPFCGRAHPLLTQILQEFEGRVRMVFKHFPLSSHQHAAPAARAAVAAGNQGKFWEMHDMLFEHQTQLEAEHLERYAEEIGLDMDRFLADLEDPATQARVERDREEGLRLDVEGTPTIYINGRLFREPPSALAAYIREELGE